MSDDLISRRALMKEFADFVKRSNNSDFAPTPTWNDAVSLVGSMPSAETEQWHVLSRRPMDEDERKEWSERFGYDIEYDDPFIYSNLPEDEGEVIICTHSAYVCTDIYYNDDGSYFDNYELDEVVAWMPLPEPYRI